MTVKSIERAFNAIVALEDVKRRRTQEAEMAAWIKRRNAEKWA